MALRSRHSDKKPVVLDFFHQPKEEIVTSLSELELVDRTSTDKLALRTLPIASQIDANEIYGGSKGRALYTLSGLSREIVVKVLRPWSTESPTELHARHSEYINLLRAHLGDFFPRTACRLYKDHVLILQERVSGVPIRDFPPSSFDEGLQAELNKFLIDTYTLWEHTYLNPNKPTLLPRAMYKGHIAYVSPDQGLLIDHSRVNIMVGTTEDNRYPKIWFVDTGIFRSIADEVLGSARTPLDPNQAAYYARSYGYNLVHFQHLFTKVEPTWVGLVETLRKRYEVDVWEERELSRSPQRGIDSIRWVT